MTDERADRAHRAHRQPGASLLLVTTAVLLVAGLLGADLSASTRPAWGLITHAGDDVIGPPPGTPVVLDSVVSAERQIISLTAYTNAQAYLKLAQSDASAATTVFDRAVTRWRAAKADLARAVRVEQADRRTVSLYEEALYELGIAEYTGVSVQSNLSLPSQEHQVEKTSSAVSPPLTPLTVSSRPRSPAGR